MQNALAREEDFSVVLLNYTKQKRAFWNMIEIAHVRDKTNHIKFIVGLQNEVIHVDHFPLSTTKVLIII